nr:8453_t:CDS:2 [Entrophospora candida]CAG8476327.1 7593_t:CDS:2 [Entrophospora candida]
MSSLRNAVQRRNHKERSQLHSRKRYGLLEKHKDYVLRARDYHSKQERLKKLREKAYFRNPDEFYFKMINSKTKEGVHIQERNNAFSGDMIKLLKSQDLNYVKTQHDLGQKKIEKLKNEIHFIEPNLKKEIDDKKLNLLKDQDKQQHIIFVDTKEEARSFDIVKHFETLPELMDRKFNRPRVETLKKIAIINAPDDEHEIQKLNRQKLKKYKELIARMERQEELKRAEMELQTQKNLMGKGRRRKVGVDKNGLAIFKWKNDRKK